MNTKIIFFLIGVLIVVFPLHAFGDGACCNPDGSCHINFNEGDCEEGEGSIWQGDDTDCEPNPCPQPSTAIPTFSEWGKITLIVLAGVGAAYYLRRRTKEES